MRGYVIFCNGYTFVYNGLEVRLPSWDMDIESLLLEEAQRFGGDSCESGNGPQQLWSDEVEQECCGSSHARPYNESRSKHDTKRYLIDELVELIPFTPQILDCLRQVFGALTPELRARHGIPPSHGEGAASMCVIGVDLLVSEGPRVVVVEVNNNPAMPRADKQMSSRYRAHLIQLVQGIANLGYRLATSPEPSLDGKQHQKALFDSDLQNMFIPC